MITINSSRSAAAAALLLELIVIKHQPLHGFALLHQQALQAVQFCGDAHVLLLLVRQRFFGLLEPAPLQLQLLSSLVERRELLFQ